MKKSVMAALGFMASAMVAFAAEFEINVPSGTTKTVSEALSATGKTSADIRNMRIVKTGGGTLVGQASVNTFLGTTIREGVFAADLNDAFGQAIHTDNADTIYVREGATLAMTGTTDSYNINNRKVHIAGSGAPGMGGAIVGKRALPTAGQWFLDADAVVASDNADATSDTGYTKMFEMQGSVVPYLNFKGRTLTLRAVNGSKGFLWAWGLRFLVNDATENATGRVVLDGCELADRSKTFAGFKATRDARSYVTLALKNGASFRPSSQAPISLFAGIDAEPGTTIGAFKDSSVAAFGITVGDFAGAPAFEEKITSLTVTNRFTVRVADLANDKRLTLAGPITFGAGARLAVEGDLSPLARDQDGRVKIAVSDSSVSGTPIPGADLPLGWSVATGSDGKSLDLVYSALVFSVADRKAGTILNFDGDRVFDEKTPLVVVGDLDDLTALAVAAADRRVTIATATGTITGLPPWKKTWATRHWTLELAADGKSLAFVYDSLKPSANYIDAVADWGLKTGEENAAANSAVFAEKLAALTGGRVIYFPKGEYYFTEPLVINKAEIGLRGDNGASILRAADGFTGSVLVSIEKNHASVKNMTLQGVSGPAISVSDCVSFIATGVTFKDVGGAIEGVEGRYPISAVNVQPVEFYGNASAESPSPYAGIAYLGGTTTKTVKCEPNASEVNIFVGEGETLDFYTALNRTCYRKADLKGQKLIKFGPGTLVGTNDLASKTGSYFLGLDVQEGVFRAEANNDFGYSDSGDRDPPYVRSGATLRLGPTLQIKLQNRVVHIAGSGFMDEPGAIVCEGFAESNGAQFRLEDDAVIATTFTLEYPLIFQSGGVRSNCDFQGHALTLRGAEGGLGFRFANKFQTRGTGRLIVDGVYLGQASQPVISDPWPGSRDVTLELKNGAVFRPRTQDVVSLFDCIEVDATSRVWGGEASAAAFDMTIGGWAGAGSVDAGISSLTITDSFAASADDLLAGHHMTALCPITFADGVRMTLENAAALEVGDAPYLCAVSEASLTGLPVRAPGCRFRGWAPESGEDGKSLLLGRIGMLLFLR